MMIYKQNSSPHRGRQNPELMMEILESPYTVPGLSDGGAHVKFSTAGVYPTNLLTWLVRDEQRMTLEDAHHKLSYLPAFMGGFRDRGYLLEGAAADIVVYDLENLKATNPEIVHDLPAASGGGSRRRKDTAGPLLTAK